jgi:hypothetical protein
MHSQRHVMDKAAALYSGVGVESTVRARFVWRLYIQTARELYETDFIGAKPWGVPFSC